MAGRHAGWDHTAAGRMCQEVHEPFWFGDSDATAEPSFRSGSDYRRFEEMASFMGALKTALSIRMSQLGLLKRNDLHDPYALVRIEKDEEDGL